MADAATASPPTVPLTEGKKSPLHNSSGWDGKQRVENRAVVVNGDALGSDGEGSLSSADELEGETIAPDEGRFALLFVAE